MLPLVSALLFFAAPAPQSLQPTLPASPASAQEADDASERIFGVNLRGAAGASLPEAFDVPLHLPARSAGREEVLLHLERYSLRSPSLRLTTWDPRGEVEVSVPPVSTYRGWIQGRRAETVVLAHLTEDGLHASVFENGTRRWSFEPQKPGSKARRFMRAEASTWIPHRAVSDPARDASACGSDRPALSNPGGAGGTTLNATLGTQTLPAFTPGNPNVRRETRQDESGRLLLPADCGKLCEIAFESDYEYFLARGGTVQETITAIEGLMNLVDYYYGRDLNVRFELTHFLVRTAPYYTPTSGGDLLNQFRAEWNGPQAGIPRDLAHLMTGKPGSIIQYGGLAWVGALCGGIQYGWSTNSANALGHEIGHNFGAPHCLDTEECNNMCGGCLSIAGNTRRRKFEHMGTVNCLSDGGAYPTPVPPFVENERFDVHAGQLAEMLNVPLEIDVLANDDDGNCDPIGIGSFDPFSLRGGQIQSTPVAGGLRLTYTPPAIPFRGRDEFAYTVVDSTGLSAEGRVVIEVRPEELRAYWPMEEAAGVVLGDATWRAQEGALEGGVNWTSGPSGSALLFDGNDDVVRLPALDLDLPRDQLTITGWLRRDGIQAPWSGVAFSRSGETVSGLMFGPSGIQLRYTWNDDPGTYNWSTGAPTPDGVWCFFGLTVRGDQATVHLHDGTSWVHGTNVRPHEGQRFEDEWFLGQDSGSSARRFAGALDEVRVHDYALSNAEIESLRLANAPAAAPAVRDGDAFWPLPDALNWVPGGAGNQRRLYLSPNYFTVAQATPGSPSDLGLFNLPEFAMPVLFPGLRHYWRVDEVSQAGVELPGPVWQFDPGRWNHWTLDETSNALPVLEEEEGANGSFNSGPVLGVPGATARTGTAMRLSGSPQYASLPPLLLNSDRLTITCWFKRAAGQSGRQGLVFSRATGTTAGLDINDTDQLGYHWHSSSHWGWDSGLVVPTDTWVFAALVVEPDRGRVFLGDTVGSPLVSATNETGHNVLSFSGPLDIGRDAHSGPRYFVGDIDDVRVFRGSLTESQIDRIYQSSL